MNLILTLFNLLNMYQIIWTKTIIEIPLNDNTYEYYEVPKANLYKNGKLIDNEEYYYERGVNRTSLSVVNSKHVKCFYIDYRITFYELGIQSEQTITFSIVDNIQPEVIKVPKFRYPVNTKIPSEKVLLENLHYKDNYYENKEISVKINNLPNININKVGIYEIEYELMDPSYNTTIITTTYEIFDNNYPIINYKEPLIHNVDNLFNHYNYFTYIGNNLIIDVDDSKINYKMLGIYQIIIKATNESNLSTTITTSIEIVDIVSPKIQLKYNIAPIEVNTLITNELLLNYVLNVSDNYDQLGLRDIEVLNDIDSSKLGKYVINYKVKDSSNNEGIGKLNVNVVDTTKPNIYNKDDLIFNVFEKNLYWLNHFNIEDNYDEFDDLKIKFIDKNINFDVIGSYYLEIEVTDTSKNKSVKIVEVFIKDLIPPTVENVNEIYIYDFKKKEPNFFKTHFNVIDNYDEYNNVLVVIHDLCVNYNQIGEYEISINFTDKSNNSTIVETTIYILDIYSPMIDLYYNNIIYYIGDEIPDFFSNILSVSDNFDNLSLTDVNIYNNINYNKIGKYEVIYELTDSSYNYKRITLDFFVDKNEEILITGTNLKLSNKSYWNELDGIKLGKEVLHYECFYEHFTLDEVSNVEILYIAYDSRGNSQNYVQTLEIVNDIQNKNNYFYKIIILTIVFSGIITIMYYKSKKNNSVNFVNIF